MSIFGKKRELSRPEFRQILRKASPRIPGAGGRMYSWRERVKMEKEIFPYQRFKGNISEFEVKRRLKELRMERYRAKTQKEKINVDRKIRFLKEVTGVKPY
jgi:hypothetical protein